MAELMFFIYGLGWTVGLILLVHFYRRRQKIKHMEDFEDRYN